MRYTIVVGCELSLTVRRGCFFQCAARSWCFFLINDLIKTATSGICRPPDSRHLNVPELVKKKSESKSRSAYFSRSWQERTIFPAKQRSASLRSGSSRFLSEQSEGKALQVFHNRLELKHLKPEHKEVAHRVDWKKSRQHKTYSCEASVKKNNAAGDPEGKTTTEVKEH